MAVKKVSSASSAKTTITVGVIMLIIAIGLLIGGTFFVTDSAKKLGKFIKTDAVVVGYEERRETDSDGHRKTLYAEIVEYEIDGKTYTATSSSASTSPKSKGATIKIAYNPDNPNECIFIGSTVMATVILFVLGVAFAAAGAYLTVGHIRSRTTTKKQKTEPVLEPGVKEVDIDDIK